MNHILESTAIYRIYPCIMRPFSLKIIIKIAVRITYVVCQARPNLHTLKKQQK